MKKKFFKPNMKEEYNLRNRPSIIPLEQWKILLKFWKSNMAKVIVIYSLVLVMLFPRYAIEVLFFLFVGIGC